MVSLAAYYGRNPTTTCAHCGQTFTMKGISRHQNSKACGRIQNIKHNFLDKGYLPTTSSVYNTVASPSFSGRVKHVKQVASFDRFKHNGEWHQATEYWVEAWFVKAYKALYTITKGRFILCYVYLFQAVFVAKTEDERDTYIELGLMRAAHDYGYKL